MPELTATTPLRALAGAVEAGCMVLTADRVDYADGGEARVLELVARARDRTSGSEELEGSAEDWPTRYHLAAARADALRLLDLPEHARVLEIGAGCGAMTRYLGETAAVVDAVEPMPDRARVAALRTQDLDSVCVFVGGVEDVPAEPAYDVVLVWGVLEYVANGSGEHEAYVAFLAAIRERLAPGGVLVLGIENALGAKYLAGSPEDHNGRPFDSVEGYGRPTPARTFGRGELLELLAAAGFAKDPTVLQAFPDYKFTRLLVSDEALADPRARHLAWEAANFPSPDRSGDRYVAADERAVWRQLARNGVGGNFGNSFVVLASAADDVDGAPLWERDRLAAFASTARSRPYRTTTRIERDGAELVVRRTRVEPELGVPASGPSHTVLAHEPFLDGRSVSETVVGALLDGDTGQAETRIAAWAAFVAARLKTDPDLLDLAAHNVQDVGGELVAFDQEWRDASWSPAARTGRIAYLLARVVHDEVPEERLTEPLGVNTFEDLVRWIGRQIDAGLPEDWIHQFIRAEARFSVQTGSGGATRDASQIERDIEAQLTLPVSSGRRSLRGAQSRHRDQVEHDYGLQTTHVRNLEAELDGSRAGLLRANAQLEGIYASRWHRLGERLRSIRLAVLRRPTPEA